MKSGLLSAYVMMFAGFVGGCALDATQQETSSEEDSLHTAGQELTNAPYSSSAPEVVRLQFSNTGCTGITVTQSLIVTAAHCVENLPEYGTSRVKVYYYHRDGETGTRVYPATNTLGRASYFRHPSYGGSPFYHHDFALIKLYDGGMSMYSRGRFYMDSRQPWDKGSSEPNRVNVFGTGRGSDPGETVHCDEAGVDYGFKRRGSKFWLHRTGGPGTEDVVSVAMRNGQHICRGDSGGAWTLERGYFLSFAVTSHLAPSFWFNTAYASGIARHWSWMYDVAHRERVPIACPNYVTTDGYIYKRCRE